MVLIGVHGNLQGLGIHMDYCQDSPNLEQVPHRRLRHVHLTTSVAGHVGLSPFLDRFHRGVKLMRSLMQASRRVYAEACVRTGHSFLWCCAHGLIIVWAVLIPVMLFQTAGSKDMSATSTNCNVAPCVSAGACEHTCILSVQVTGVCIHTRARVYTVMQIWHVCVVMHTCLCSPYVSMHACTYAYAAYLCNINTDVYMDMQRFMHCDSRCKHAHCESRGRARQSETK